MTATTPTPTVPTIHKLGKLEPTLPSQMRLNNGLIIVNMGPSGGGKTTLVETLLPQYAPVALLDVDGKAHVLHDYPNGEIDVFSTKTWDEIDGAIQALEGQSLHPYYKTLVVDGTSAMQLASWDKTNVKNISNPQLKQTAYGQANILMVDIAQRARILAERGMNVIFNVWAVKEKGELGSQSEIVSVTPDLTPTLLNRMLGIFDFVVYTEPNSPPKPYPPVMRTGGSPLYATRSASAPDSPLRDLPALIYNPSYTSILDSYHGTAWPTQKHTKQ